MRKPDLRIQNEFTINLYSTLNTELVSKSLVISRLAIAIIFISILFSFITILKIEAFYFIFAIVFGFIIYLWYDERGILKEYKRDFEKLTFLEEQINQGKYRPITIKKIMNLSLSDLKKYWEK